MRRIAYLDVSRILGLAELDLILDFFSSSKKTDVRGKIVLSLIRLRMSESLEALGESWY